MSKKNSDNFDFDDYYKRRNYSPWSCDIKVLQEKTYIETFLNLRYSKIKDLPDDLYVGEYIQCDRLI